MFFLSKPSGQLDFLAEHGYQAHCGTMRPTSRGSVTLASNSPLEAPLIDPNFLATEEDRRDLRAGLRLTIEIMEQQALQEFKRETWFHFGVILLAFLRHDSICAREQCQNPEMFGFKPRFHRQFNIWDPGTSDENNPYEPMKFASVGGQTATAATDVDNKERYAPLQNINLESDEEVDAWIRASSHSGG